MDSTQFLTNLMQAGVTRGTPLLFATLGEILTERSGILNLGVEGMMLMGAMVGYGVTYWSGNLFLGVFAGVIAGGLVSLLHAFVAITLKGDQVVSGLALTFFATGFAAVLGAPLVDVQEPVARVPNVAVPILQRLPFAGTILFDQNLFVYLGYLLIPFMWFITNRTRIGLHLRACGENPVAADAMGVPVQLFRYMSVFLGGCLSGLAGVSLSLAITPGWIEGMTAGQGWIAIGLVIFAGWNPLRAAFGAYLFGAIRRLPLDLQGLESISFFLNPNIGYFLNMLPYLFCIIALLISSRSVFRMKMGAPAALGLPFHRGSR